MAGSTAQMRNWKGPAILSFGFRPFFLLGAAWAAISMAIWIAMFVGAAGPPVVFAPVDWHAHEMLFGYLPAAAAGFLLTAIPNWTGRLPIAGWPLAGLVFIWIAGRAVTTFGGSLPALAIAAVDVAFLVVFAFVAAREVIAGKNWRNLKVLFLVATLAAANALFHFEASRGGYAAGGVGARLAVAVAMMLIVVIGGRIVPSFTRNWLARNSAHEAAPAPFGRFDGITMVASLIALASWVFFPTTAFAAAACAIAGGLNFAHLLRWRGWRAAREALVWILHAGFAFVPLGFLAIAAAWAFPDVLPARAAQHVFMAGAIGVMTLAVMTRASLGHSGRELHAGGAITGIYVCAIAAALLRLADGFAPVDALLLYAAAVLWVAAFAGFVVVYAPMLTQPRRN